MPEHNGARDLGVEPAGAVDLDQQGQMIAAVERALLQMARHERRDGPDAGRGTEKDALLAAELLALALSKRRNIDVPQSRPNSLDHAREDLVLQAGRAADETDFLLALDRLVTVDEPRCIDEAALARKALLQSGCEGMRDPAGIDQTDVYAPAALDLVEREVGIVSFGVVDGEKRGRVPYLSDAAVQRVLSVKIAL